MIGVVIFVFILLSPIIHWLILSHYPIYKGKPVKKWVSEINWSPIYTYKSNQSVDVLLEMDPEELVPVLVTILRSLRLLNKLECFVSDTHLMDSPSLIQVKAAYMLGEMGPKAEPAIDNLIIFLDCGNSIIAKTSATALGKIRKRPEVCIPALIKIVANKSHPIRATAIQAIADFGPMAKPYHKEWRFALFDDNFMIRAYTIRAMNSAGIHPEEMIEQFIKLLDHPDEFDFSQKTAAKKLGEFGSASKEAIPKLLSLLEHEDEDVRFAAAFAICRIDSSLMENTLPIVAAFTKHKSPSYRITALEALWELAPDRYPIMPALLTMVKSPDVFDRIRGVDAILRIDPGWTPNAIPILIDILKVRDEHAQSRAAAILGKIGPKAIDAIPALKELLDHEDHDLKVYVNRALTAIEKE